MLCKIIIDGELCDLNNYINAERANRYAAANIKKKETNKCKLHVKNIKCKDKDLKLKFKWYCKNAMKDPDNICFAKKFILDGMVQAKVIPNDGFKNIKGFEDHFFIDRENPRIEVEIYG